VVHDISNNSKHTRTASPVMAVLHGPCAHEYEGNTILENIRTTQPPTQSCIPEDLNPQKHHCEYLIKLLLPSEKWGY